MPIETIRKMREEKVHDNTFLIGIDGLGGSGKTTLACKLKNELENTFVFHLDDFVFPKEIRYDGSFEEWYCYYHLQWRVDYIVQTILSPLKNGKVIHEYIEFYNKNTDTYRNELIFIPKGSIVIFEGVFLQRNEFRKFFDFVIVVDETKENRWDRIVKRDTYIGSAEMIQNKYERRYFPAEEVYVKEYNPIELADYIYQNEMRI